MNRAPAQLPDIGFFHRLADKAATIALAHYRQPLDIEEKGKPGHRFDPVTVADKQIEQAIRALIGAEFPDHAIFGEEFGETGHGPIRWIIDPIDGTKPFICGIPVWATLVGLAVDGRARMGMLSQPFTGERFWATGSEALTNGPLGSRQLHTSTSASLSRAILHLTSPERLTDFPAINFANLRDRVRLTRYGGECYAFAMLAAGQIDLCFEPILQPHDLAALIPIVEQAGGVITTLDGGRPENGGAILASANDVLHQQALRLLAHR